jgi:hypothetical protein
MLRWRTKGGRPGSRAPQVEVIALTRFSWPGLGGFQTRHAALAERRAALYAPERLALRLRLFQALTLPALAAQTDPDFTLGVLIGPDLPGWARDRLEGALAALPQARLIARPPGPHRAVLREVMAGLRRNPAAMAAQFRMDDDDAVGRSFVARLRAIAGQHAALAEGRGYFGVDFVTGWEAEAGPAGLHAAPLQLSGLGVAQALVVAPGRDKATFDFAHHRMHRFMAVLSLPDPDMFLRGLHDQNDSRPARRALPALDAAGEAHLRAAFGIDAAHVRGLWRTPLPVL